ncbi:arsenate reductase (glutaredoxin) [Massilia violaceinigra]|uniref:Arsenate reductase n=1 Tax=Massilia violaceinigra TaxID=2045208 RepID=A0ABY4A5M4_9BURK|nr:arsenate reductase (glutaredoxin) [Massilia violaceinigra]UOD29445.1 arsenate reductase (glutaredoxin) [Massilia violaceinigra]
MTITIYHNARCSNSRRALELILAGGFDPQIIDYIAEPPTRAVLAGLIAGAGLSVRDAMRTKEPEYAALGLADAADDALLDAMVAHPTLINRPFVVTPLGVRLCRPGDLVQGILPAKEA